MEIEIHKLLLDIQSAIRDIEKFTQGYNLEAYRSDAKCKAAVERKFEIIGEACTRLRDKHPAFFENFENGHMIIGFRNRLIHGYDAVDDGIVWDVVQGKIKPFGKKVIEILNANEV